VRSSGKLPPKYSPCRRRFAKTRVDAAAGIPTGCPYPSGFNILSSLLLSAFWWCDKINRSGRSALNRTDLPGVFLG
jgi:hypothetical protein